MDAPAYLVAALKLENGETLADLMISAKQFKTGSRGYYVNQKVEIQGKRYQVQVQIVEIGSKQVASASENG